jgi:hypothetical protein
LRHNIGSIVGVLLKLLAFAVRTQKFSGAVYLPAIKAGSSGLGDPG